MSANTEALYSSQHHIPYSKSLTSHHTQHAGSGVSEGSGKWYGSLRPIVSAAPSLDKKTMIPFVCCFVQPCGRSVVARSIHATMTTMHARVQSGRVKAARRL